MDRIVPINQGPGFIRQIYEAVVIILQQIPHRSLYMELPVYRSNTCHINSPYRESFHRRTGLQHEISFFLRISAAPPRHIRGLHSCGRGEVCQIDIDLHAFIKLLMAQKFPYGECDLTALDFVVPPLGNSDEKGGCARGFFALLS